MFSDSRCRQLMNLICTFVLFAIFGLFTEQAIAGDQNESHSEAKAWLDKIALADKSVNYEGNFIFRRDDQLVTMHVVHVVDEAGERERLSSLSGVQREFFRGKEGIVCLSASPKQHNPLNREILRGNFPTQLGRNLQDIQKNYRLILGDTDRIAGRNARMIIIAPKDYYRYGYRIWVDEKTGLLLQSDLVNERGSAVEQFMFTMLNVVDNPSPKMIQAVTMSDKMRQALKTSKPDAISAANSHWQIISMPDGFSLVERYQHSHGKWGPVNQLVLSDGMATVSVFVEQLGENAKPFNGVTHMGAVNAYGTVVNDHQLTIVGEVPLATVQLIGKSLRLSVAGN
jgi:sigma-E factor negative regulatory protein RseB